MGKNLFDDEDVLGSAMSVAPGLEALVRRWWFADVGIVRGNYLESLELSVQEKTASYRHCDQFHWCFPNRAGLNIKSAPTKKWGFGGFRIIALRNGCRPAETKEQFPMSRLWLIVMPRLNENRLLLLAFDYPDTRGRAATNEPCL